jgi:ABC-type metal ion transport system substrate-binding protein
MQLHAGAEALIIDDYQDAHTMVLVTREDNKNEEAIKKVATDFESTELQRLLVDKFKNEIVWP